MDPAACSAATLGAGDCVSAQLQLGGEDGNGGFVFFRT